MVPEDYIDGVLNDPDWQSFFHQFKEYDINLNQAILIALLYIDSSNPSGGGPYFETHLQKIPIIGYLYQGLLLLCVYVPDSYGPYSSKNRFDCDDLVNKKILRRRENYNINQKRYCYIYSLSPNIQKEIRSLIEPFINSKIWMKLVNTASYLRKSVPEIEKMATMKMESHLCSKKRQILYSSQEFERLVQNNNRQKWKLQVNLGFSSLEEIPEETEKPSNESLLEYHNKFRDEQPNCNALREERMKKMGSETLDKIFFRTDRGKSFFYNFLYEVNKVWEEGDPFTKNSLLQANVKSICRVLPDIEQVTRKIGDREFLEFTVTDDFQDFYYKNTMPMLIEKKRLKTTIKAFIEKYHDILWRPVSIAINGRLEMYPWINTEF